jgi:hypothetical protein
VRSRSHMGVRFELRNSQRSWFWIVVDPYRNGGSIGAAANEGEAIREAHASIEEMSARHRAATTASPMIGSTAPAPVIDDAEPIEAAVNGWNELLANLDAYLTQVCDARWVSRLV